MRLVVIVIVLAACSKKPDCASAVSGAVDRMVSDAKARMPPNAAANIARVVPKMKEVITATCVEDKWPSEVIACISKASSQSELNECDKQLTPAQRASEHERTNEILKAAVQPLQQPDAPKHAAPDPHAGLGSN